MVVARKTVLVAEDEPLVRMVAADALAEAGFAVMEAGDAGTALKVLNRSADRVNALFTDVHMPGPMDGLELAHHARGAWPWIALLVASGKAAPGANQLPEGCRFLAKPYALEHMLRHIFQLTG